HPGSVREGRSHPPLEVVLAGGEHQQKFGLGPHRFAKQQRAQGFGELGAARLAGQHHLPSRLAQALGVPVQVSTLAGTVDALEGDESAAHRDALAGERRRNWYSRTARLCASSVSENWLLPSPRETKYSSRVAAGVTAASRDASPG